MKKRGNYGIGRRVRWNKEDEERKEKIRGWIVLNWRR